MCGRRHLKGGKPIGFLAEFLTLDFAYLLT